MYLSKSLEKVLARKEATATIKKLRKIEKEGLTQARISILPLPPNLFLATGGLQVVLVASKKHEKPKVWHCTVKDGTFICHRMLKEDEYAVAFVPARIIKKGEKIEWSQSQQELHWSQTWR